MNRRATFARNGVHDRRSLMNVLAISLRNALANSRPAVADRSVCGLASDELGSLSGGPLLSRFLVAISPALAFHNNIPLLR
jgi:hypothetical protein